MALEIEGKLLQLLDEQTGVGQSSGKSWRKQGFVIETEEQYPKKAVFNAWNDTVDAIKSLQVGEKIRVGFRIESREYNERWYTDLTAWRIVKISEQAVTGTPQTNQEPPPEVLYGEQNNPVQENTNQADLTKDESEDDLPF
ncbi:MAG: DUF3127 domain-containing protein [Bacteroidales bacterium]|nr:DUF3127 domain-containing protein [Bacteroidales bacterium]